MCGIVSPLLKNVKSEEEAERHSLQLLFYLKNYFKYERMENISIKILIINDNIS